MKTSPRLPSFLRRVTSLAVLVSLGALSYHAIKESQASVAARHGDRANPWRGLPGCLLLKNGLSGATTYWPLAQGMELVCPTGATRAAVQAVPAQAKDLANAVYSLIAPPPDAYDTAASDTPNARETVRVHGQLLARSADVTLTLDAGASQIANALASCLTTANATDCKAAQLDPQRFAHLHEGAGARMLALVDMRIDNGAIEALASAHSPCFAQMLAAPALPAAEGCPQMPQQYQSANAWRSDNHALYNQAMWGSLVKPALALALLRGGAIRTAQDQAWLQSALKTSDTPAFLDHLFCRGKGKTFNSRCKPLAELQSAGIDLGYTSSWIDGDYDLLANSPSKLVSPAPRWLERATTDANQPWIFIATSMPQVGLLQDCAQRKWSQCKGEHLAELASHAWGQGDGKATPLAAAAAFARLGAAANHTSAGFGVAYKPTLLEPQANNLPTQPTFARAIAQGMAQTHTQGGTAHSACLAVWGSAKTCNAITTLAGKTGTPTMPHDALTLAQRKDHCADVALRLAAAHQFDTQPVAKDKVENARCSYAPYKWYVALAKDSDAPGAPWTRVVAVQIERNWSTAGQVDAAYDKGVNLAAFAAMHYLRLHHQAQQTQPRQALPDTKAEQAAARAIAQPQNKEPT